MLYAPPRSLQFKVVSKRSENLCYTPHPVQFSSRWYPSARKTFVIRSTPFSSVQGGIQALGKPIYAPPRSVQFKVVSKRSENRYTPHPVQFSSKWYPSARKTYTRPTPFSSIQSGIQALGKPIRAPPRSVQFKVVSKRSEKPIKLCAPHCLRNFPRETG